LNNYDRAKAESYLHLYSLNPNPKFYNYEHIGGDCTNFASQVIDAGCGIMSPDWYYKASNQKLLHGPEFLFCMTF